MKIDIIITTYNRPLKVFDLVRSLIIGLKDTIDKIIVVDSSNHRNDYLLDLQQVHYVCSSHKNQPYQRYLGFMLSKADVVLYLDDDMELISKGVFNDLEMIFSNNAVVGLAINFNDKNRNNSLPKVPISINKKTNNLIGNFFRYISVNSIPKQGQIGLFGLRGMQPSHLSETTIISGGAFAARREMLFENFNFQLFDLFEKKMGMGEDTLIGCGLSKMGKVLFYEPICFLHNDETGSNYSMDVWAYSKRVFFSRYFIANEKARLDMSHSKLRIKVLFIVYSIFRLLGLFLRIIIKPSKIRLLMIKGAFSGFGELLNFQSLPIGEAREYWMNEVKKDLR